MNKKELKKLIEETINENNLNEIMSNTIGSVQIINADCNRIEKFKSAIIAEYLKIKKPKDKLEYELEAYNTKPTQYKIIPNNSTETLSRFKAQFGKNTILVFDSVEVAYDLSSNILYLTFTGYKIDKKVKVQL